MQLIMNISTILAATVIATGLLFTSQYSNAQDPAFLDLGKRIVIKTDGRKDYKPKIIECDTSSVKLCIRDTRANPKNIPLEPNEYGDLVVSFPSWKTSYIIAADGTGRTLDDDGNELKPFTWKLK